MPSSQYILTKSLLPQANKLKWLSVDLSTARNNVSLDTSGISIFTSMAWIENGIFTLTFKQIDNTSFAMTQDDFKQLLSFDARFNDILITNGAQAGVTIKFAVAEYISE